MMVGPMTANRFQSGEAERLNPVGLTQRFRFRADTSDRAVTQFRFLDDPAGAFQIAYEYVTDEWVKQGGGVYSNSIAADSNTVLFDDVLFEAECMWRVLRALGEPFFDEKDEAVRLTEALISQESGRTIKLRDRPFLGENVPEGNWPTP